MTLAVDEQSEEMTSTSHEAPWAFGRVGDGEEASRTKVRTEETLKNRQ